MQLVRLGSLRSPASRKRPIPDIKRYAAEHDTGRYWKGKGKQLPDTGKKDERVEPEWQPTPSGGGSSDLAEEETGYFEHVIIENYKED